MALRAALAVLLAAATALGCTQEELNAAPRACYARSELGSERICELLEDACQSPSEPLPALSEPVKVVPDADAMPDGVTSQTAHNNLDVVWHRGRLFLAFRTAPSHFADWRVELYVVSTTDQNSWQLETRIALEKDLREPRFLSLGDDLFLYFARLGEKTFTFEPESMMMTKQVDGCIWTEPVDVEPTGDPGFIPWRAREIDGVGYLTGYVGGGDIYDEDDRGLEVHWLKTRDGERFEPVAPGQSAILTEGASETDWAFLPGGSVVGVSRNEAGDDGRFGSKICRAPADDLGDWSCVHDPRKYDSPLLFRHGDTVYLIARRQVAHDGLYDLGYDLPPEEQAAEYQIEYWNTPKRCALWTVDPDALEVEHVLDLPTNGDTCFPSAVRLEDSQYLVYDYTSPLDDPGLAWNEGQNGPTYIYRLTLTLPD